MSAAAPDIVGPVTLPVLQSDCSQCFALCCVLLPFSAVSGFGVDKPGGTPCLNLLDDDRCGIHASLRADGWPGCTVFECFGAGQQVSQVTYSGVSWREQDNLAEMGAVLSVMRQLHEMLVHLSEVGRRSPDPVRPRRARRGRGTHGRRPRVPADARRRRAPRAGGAACSPTPAPAYDDAGPTRPTGPAPTWPVDDCPATTAGGRSGARPSSRPISATPTSLMSTCSAPTCGTRTCAGATCRRPSS